MNDLIDHCTNFIEAKDCFYLAKEGLIVYFATSTGRSSDYLWHKLTVSESLRIIKATRLSAEQSVKLKQEHLIAAFQELARVFEYGVKSRFKVAPGVFNYSDYSDQSIGDNVISLICDELQKDGFNALYMNDVISLIAMAQNRLNIKIKPVETRELMHKYFEAAGYEMRTGPYRPLLDGRKQPAIMKAGAKPSEVVHVPREFMDHITNKVWKELRNV